MTSRPRFDDRTSAATAGLETDRVRDQFSSFPGMRVLLEPVEKAEPDADRMVADGHVRPALFKRFSAVTIHVPPLRERREDIPILAIRFLETGPARVGLKNTLREARSYFEREYIAAVLALHHGRISDTAGTLGIQRTNLYRKLRSLHLTRPRGPEAQPAGDR